MLLNPCSYRYVMVARAGVQPATFALGVRCSMQLSYRAMVFGRENITGRMDGSYPASSVPDARVRSMTVELQEMVPRR